MSAQWSNESMETNCRVMRPLVPRQGFGRAFHARRSGSAAVAHFNRSLASRLIVRLALRPKTLYVACLDLAFFVRTLSPSNSRMVA